MADLIEEAWKALNYVGAQKEEIVASKVLALAVLEEAENSGCLYPGCDHPCTDCPIKRIGTRIKALGS